MMAEVGIIKNSYKEITWNIKYDWVVSLDLAVLQAILK